MSTREPKASSPHDENVAASPSSPPPLTYREAGVDIDAADAFVAKLARLAGTTHTENVLDARGGFAGLYRLAPPESAHDTGEALVACTDGVGTKVRLAFALNKHDTIGVDLVAMNANDALVCGARPLFFLDYIACGKLEENVLLEVVRGIAEGCKLAGCALIGGETAEMPDSYPPGEYDLAGFLVGIVALERMLDGSRVREGDVLLGLASNGLHSNGYSLARRALLERAKLELTAHVDELDATLGEVLLAPTRIYVPAVRRVLEGPHAEAVHAMAHITGGGIPGNLPRVIPPSLEAQLNWQSWPVPRIFELVARAGGVEPEEMRRTFNMGIGYVLVVEPESAEAVTVSLEASGEKVYRLGEVRPASETSS